MHAQNKQKWRACTDVEIVLKERTTSDHSSDQGIAALAVLRSSHVFQVTPHIVGLIALCTGKKTHWLSRSVNSFTKSFCPRSSKNSDWSSFK